jgi:hypothetical protein
MFEAHAVHEPKFASLRAMIVARTQHSESIEFVSGKSKFHRSWQSIRSEDRDDFSRHHEFLPAPESLCRIGICNFIFDASNGKAILRTEKRNNGITFCCGMFWGKAEASNFVQPTAHILMKSKTNTEKIVRSICRDIARKKPICIGISKTETI